MIPTRFHCSVATEKLKVYAESFLLFLTIPEEYVLYCYIMH